MESIPDKYTPVLVVDDDEGLLLSIKATLVSSGLPEPALLSDSRNAVALMRSHRFQLVLLDLMMPHLNGTTVLEQIKREFPDSECVVVSANDEVATAVEAMSLNGPAFAPANPRSPRRVIPQKPYPTILPDDRTRPRASTARLHPSLADPCTK